MYFGFGLDFDSSIDLKIGRDVAEDVLRQVEMCRGEQVLVFISLRYDARAHEAERILSNQFQPALFDYRSHGPPRLRRPHISQRWGRRTIINPSTHLNPSPLSSIRGPPRNLPGHQAVRLSTGSSLRSLRSHEQRRLYNQTRSRTRSLW